MRGYWYHFYDKSKQDHFFYDDVHHLSQIVRHFKFDNSLRILVFDAISRIEISVRTRFIYELATEYGPFPFKKENFVFKTESAWVKSYEKLLEDISHSKEEYIRHYRDTYQEEIPPIWIMGELMTFGEISNWFDNFLPSYIKKKISLFYGIQPIVMSSWLRTLSCIRNIAAHHDRLWNKILPFEVMIPNKTHDDRFKGLFVAADKSSNNSKRVYNALIVIQYLLNQIGLDEGSNQFLKGVQSLMEKYHIENYKRMGIPIPLKQIIDVI